MAIIGPLRVDFEAIESAEKGGKDLPAGGAIGGHLLQHAIDGTVQCPLEVLFLGEEGGLDDGGIGGLLASLGIFLVLLEAVEHGVDVEVLPC